MVFALIWTGLANVRVCQPLALSPLNIPGWPAACRTTSTASRCVSLAGCALLASFRLVLLDHAIETADAEQQAQLCAWLDECAGTVQVVSTTTLPLFPLVTAGAFSRGCTTASITSISICRAAFKPAETRWRRIACPLR